MIQVENLTNEFAGPDGAVRALDDVSFRVRSGEFFAVQGPSGCGKTTLLLAVGAMLRPTGGTVLVDGTDPYALSSGGRNNFRADNIGFVFQEFHLIPYLTVLENIVAASLARPRPDAAARARELAVGFNLESRLDHTPAQLSTGECQRTAMARALLNEPKILLADEPTGNLDSVNAETVLEGLREFAESGGAVLLVTHDREAAAHADRSLHMRDGRLEE